MSVEAPITVHSGTAHKVEDLDDGVSPKPVKHRQSDPHRIGTLPRDGPCFSKGKRGKDYTMLGKQGMDDTMTVLTLYDDRNYHDNSAKDW
jgi:hypothetical protein